MTAQGGSANRRLSLVTVDQILSSLSNIAALIWVAHAFEPIDFGRFSLVVLVYTVAQVVFRSLISTTAIVHPEDADTRAGDILGATIVLGIGASILCSAAGLALIAADSAMGGPILVFGLSLTFLVLHDVGRYLAIAKQQPAGAVTLDSLWFALLIVGFVGTEQLGLDSLTWLIAAWTGSGVIASLWVFVQCGAPTGGGLAWLRARWDFSWRSMVSGLSASGTALATASLMTLFSSPIAVAAFRAATLLGAPSTAVQMAVGTSAAADIAREREDPGAVWRHVRRAILIATVVGILNLVVLVFLPDVVGHAVLGEAWDIVEPLMLAVSLKVLLMAAQSGLRASLIGTHRIQAAMVTDVVSIVLVGACMVVGAAWGDAEGALWAMAVGTGVSTVCWWIAVIWKGRGPLPDLPAKAATDEHDGREPVPARPVRVAPGKHRA
jgi:O-antigen/teichoic acid export membrane protein